MLADDFVDMMFAYENPVEMIKALEAKGKLPNYLVYGEGKSLRAVKIEPNTLIEKLVPGIANDAILWEDIELFVKPRKFTLKPKKFINWAKRPFARKLVFDAEEYARYLTHRYKIPRELAESIAAHTKVRMDAVLDVANMRREFLPRMKEVNEGMAELRKIATTEEGLKEVREGVYSFRKPSENAEVYRVAIALDKSGAEAIRDVVRWLRNKEIPFELNTNPDDGASVLRIFVDKSKVEAVKDAVNTILRERVRGLALTAGYVFKEGNKPINAQLKFREKYLEIWKAAHEGKWKKVAEIAGIPFKKLKEIEEANRAWLRKMRDKGFFGKVAASGIDIGERLFVNSIIWGIGLYLANATGVIPKGSPLDWVMKGSASFLVWTTPYPKGIGWKWKPLMVLAALGIVGTAIEKIIERQVFGSSGSGSSRIHWETGEHDKDNKKKEKKKS